MFKIDEIIQFVAYLLSDFPVRSVAVLSFTVTF